MESPAGEWSASLLLAQELNAFLRQSPKEPSLAEYF